MTINIIHLVWIVPLSAMLGILSCMALNHKIDEYYDVEDFCQLYHKKDKHK